MSKVLVHNICYMQSSDKGNVRMKESTVSIRVEDVLFYLFLFFMFFTKGLGLYDGQMLYRLLFWSAMLCAVGKIVLTDYTRMQWLWVITLGILAVVIERHSGEKGVLICYTVVMGMKGIPLKRIMQIGAATYGVTMCGMVTYYGLFLEQSTYREEIRIGLGSMIRYGLGYPHPNNLLVTYLAFITMLIFWLGKKYNWKHAVLLLLGMLYLYWYCMSYTGAITCVLMIVLPLYLTKIRRGKLGAIEYAVGGAALPLALAYSFLSPYYMPETILTFLQQKLSTFYSRLILAKMYVIPENMSLLGTRVAEVTTSEFSLDNSFLYTFIFNGILFFVIIILAYFYMMYRLIKEKRNLELIITCVFLVEAIMEPLLFNTSFKNITLFFLGSVIWEMDRTGSQEKGIGIHMYIPIPAALTSLGECMTTGWEMYRIRILSVTGAVGGLALAGCMIRSAYLDASGWMTSEVMRNNAAIAWAVTVTVFVGMYVGSCTREAQ